MTAVRPRPDSRVADQFCLARSRGAKPWQSTRKFAGHVCRAFAERLQAGCVSRLHVDGSGRCDPSQQLTPLTGVVFDRPQPEPTGDDEVAKAKKVVTEIRLLRHRRRVVEALGNGAHKLRWREC
jgi:hypothetical protein